MLEDKQHNHLGDETPDDSANNHNLSSHEVAQEQVDIRDDTPVSELDEVLAKVEEFKAALQRERADFSNFRKRVDRERAELRPSIVADTIAKFLPIVDDFERAIENTPDDLKESDWFKGFAMIHKKFQSVLEQYGIETINPVGEPFDHNLHDAIGSEDTDEYESGTVIDVLQKGYMMNGRCIRPAMVRVAM